jgi:putative hydrolase of the HAD superfamily
MRKPEERIYLHTVARLDLRPAEVVFVDDLPVNVRGAVAAGLVGVRHQSFDQTVLELEGLFGLVLR